MEIAKPEIFVEQSSNFEEASFSISEQDMGLVFEILRSKVYENPIGSICREICSNARDANREVGKSITPIEVEIQENQVINHHPITEEGNFIAYKKVEVKRVNSTYNKDFYNQHEVNSFIADGTIDSKKWVDHYSGKFINNKGKIVRMDRNLVDPNRSTSCSVGLHVAAFSYAHSFSGTIMIEVLVDPKDVVSVPFDECDTKMRVCEYRVIDRYKEDKEIKKSVVKETKYKETQSTTGKNSKFKTESQLKELKAREIFEYCKQIKLDIKETPSLLKSKASLIKKVLKLQNEKK